MSQKLAKNISAPISRVTIGMVCFERNLDILVLSTSSYANGKRWTKFHVYHSICRLP